MLQTKGIHHITAIVGHPQENVDFYAHVLGLRLVKKTINFDDPGTYHLYFGNEAGDPGTIITFFPWPGAAPGVIGGGQVGVTAYAVPKGALSYWQDRLHRLQIPSQSVEKFGERSLRITDPHGLQVELVEREEGEESAVSKSDVAKEFAIKGFAGVTLLSTDPEKTATTLEDVMGISRMEETNDLIRFRSSAPLGNVIDLKRAPVHRGKMGVGTVHHIAWRTEDQAEQLQWQKHIIDQGYHVTDVRDRNYFHAIYFREAGEILFEIATDPPGFAHDESKETMGEKLMLPKQYEHLRASLEAQLIPITLKKFPK